MVAPLYVSSCGIAITSRVPAAPATDSLGANAVTTVGTERAVVAAVSAADASVRITIGVSAPSGTPPVWSVRHATYAGPEEERESDFAVPTDRFRYGMKSAPRIAKAAAAAIQRR